MSFKAGLVNRFYHHIEKFNRSDLGKYSNIETALDYLPWSGAKSAEDRNRTGILVGKDGSIGSVIKYNGSQKMLSDKELPVLVSKIETFLSKLMRNNAYTVQVYFSRNPKQSKNLIKEIVRPSRTVANAMSLNLDYIFEEDEAVLPEWIVREDVFFVIWTSHKVLAPAMRKKSKAEESEKKKKNAFFSTVFNFSEDSSGYWGGEIDGQNPWLAEKRIMNLHFSAVDGFVKDGNGAISDSHVRDGVLSILGAEDALKAIRRSIDPSSEISSWKPFLQLDAHSMDWNRSSGIMKDRRHGRILRDDVELSNQIAFAPRMDSQLFLEGGRRIDGNFCQIGQLYYATFDMTVAPEKTEAFSRLINRMQGETGKEFPWRVSFSFFGGEQPYSGLKMIFAKMLSLSTQDGHNNNIVEGLDYISSLRQQDRPVANLRISFTTWSPVSAGLQGIEEQASSLARAVEGWGNMQVSSNSGDPVGSTMGTVLGLGKRGTAQMGSAPLSDILMMLPFSRESSPFETGSLLARTEDGRPLPLESASSKQTSFGEYIFGEPGSGKSVFLAATNLATVLGSRMLKNRDESGLDLPIIRLIDIAFSSKGLYEIIHKALPKSMKHKIVYKSLSGERDSINPFDLPLGSRKPPKFNLSMLQQFIMQLVLAPGAKERPAHMDEVVSQAIDFIFRQFSDKEGSGSRPKSYQRGVLPEVDEALEKHGLKIGGGVSWYSVMDRLAFKGEIHLAHLAQREAVPTIRDLATCDLSELRRNFNNVKRGETDTRIVEDFQITLKAICDQYKMLVDKTNFDISDARIMILDVQNVIGRGKTEEDIKQTSIMYMLAAIKMGSDFFSDPKMIDEYNQDYAFYHKPRLEKLYSTPKVFCLDEVHRTKGREGTVTIMEEMIDNFLREGRKYNIIVRIASQRVDDIKKETFENISTVWALSSNNNPKKIRDFLNISETATDYISRKLTGPTKKGAPFLVQMKMKGGIHEHFGYLTMGPQKVWAFSTTPEDVMLREKLMDMIGVEEALKVLGVMYPGGSVKEIIETKVRQKAEQRFSEEEDDETRMMVDRMADECHDFYNRMLFEQSNVRFSGRENETEEMR